MIIRGFETQGGARTVDNFLQSADADNVDESIIDRIEVTKGPNAILSPAGAPGGSLNIIKKSPTLPRRKLADRHDLEARNSAALGRERTNPSEIFRVHNSQPSFFLKRYYTGDCGSVKRKVQPVPTTLST